MANIIEKPVKNEWGLVETSPDKPQLNWKESVEYRKTAAFVSRAYGPFGKVMFTGIGVMALVALGIWGVGFFAEALELIINALRNLPNATGVGAGIGSVAGALFAACWKAAIGAIIIFPVWHGFKLAYSRFLSLIAVDQPKNPE